MADYELVNLVDDNSSNNGYELVNLVDKPQESEGPSYLDSLLHGFDMLPSNLADIGAGIEGVGAGLARKAGWDTLADAMQRTSDFTRGQTRDIREGLVDASGYDASKENLLNSMLSQSPTMAATLIPAMAAGPLGGAAVLGGTSAGQEYSSLRDRAQSADDSTNAALAAGGLNALLGRYSLGGMLSPGASRLGTIARSALYNAGDNALSDIGTKGIEEAATNIDYKLPDYVTGALSAGATGALMGGTLGALSHGALVDRNSNLVPDYAVFDQAPSQPLGIEHNTIIPDPPWVVAAREAQANQPLLLENQPVKDIIGAIPLEGPVRDFTSFEKAPSNPNTIIGPARIALENSKALIAKVQKSEIIKPDVTSEFPKPLPQKIQEAPTAEVQVSKAPTRPEQEPVRNIDTDFSEPLTGMDQYRHRSLLDSIDKVISQAPDYTVPKTIVGANPELMQFKSNADPKTGVVKQLTGKFEPMAAKNMLFWEPLDPTDPKYGLKPEEKLLVVNGHHRREFGLRTPEVTHFSGGILKEADGITLDQAKLIGAELNIREGKGSVYDEAKYFRGISKLAGPSAAIARASELGVTGRNAQSIGIRSSDNLFHAFATGRISEQHTKAITDSVRSIENPALSEAAQDFALEAYSRSTVADKKGKVRELTPSEVYHVAQDYIQEHSNSSTQFEIFKPSARDIALSTEKAKIIAKEKEKLTKELAGIKRDKKLDELPEEERNRLLAEGQDVSKISDMAKVVKKQQVIEQKLIQLEKPRLFPEFNAELNRKAEAQLKKIGYQTSILDEKGSTPILTDIAYGASDAARKFGQEIRDRLDARKMEIEETPLDRMFTAPIGAFRRQVSKLEEVSRRFGDTKQGAPIKQTWDAAQNMVTRKSRIVHDSEDKITSFKLLSPVESADAGKVMHAIRRESSQRIERAQGELEALKESVRAENPDIKEKELNKLIAPEAERIINSANLNITVEDLQRRGLTPNAAKAVMDIFDYMHNDAVDYIKEGMIALAKGDPKKEATAAMKAESLRSWNGVRRWYIPFTREGKLTLWASKEGVEPIYHMSDSKLDLYRLKKQYEEQGYKVDVGIRRPTQSSAYDELPTSVRQVLGGESEGLDPRGFKQHLTKANLTEGEGQHINNDIIDYINSLSNFTAKSHARVEFENALKQAGTKATYRDWLVKHQDEILGNKPQTLRKLNQYITLHYLGAKMAVPVQSLAQMVTTTTAKIGIKNSAIAGKLAVDYYARPKEFAKANPELKVILDNMRRDGHLEANPFGDWVNETDRTNLNAVTNFALIPFKSAENFTRLQAAIGGYLDAKKNKIAPQDKYKYITDLTNEVMFNNRKIDRPLLATDSGALGALGGPIMMFRSWGMNYFRFLRNNVKGGNWDVAAKSLAYTFGLSGMMGVPLAKTVSYYMSQAGYDPQRMIRDALEENVPYGEKVATQFLYGAPHALAGINMSGSIGLAGTLPNPEGDIAWSAMKFLGGAPVGLVDAASKSYQSYKQGTPIIPNAQNPRSALEPILPEALRRVAVTARENVEGWRTPSGTPIGHPDTTVNGIPAPHMPTVGESVINLLGMMPAKKATYYEESQTKKVAADRFQNAGNKINDRVAEMIYDIQMGRATDKDLQALIQNFYAEQIKKTPELRVEINDGAVRSALQKRIGMPNVRKAARPVMDEITKSYSNAD